MEKHDELFEALGALTHDPLAFVYFAYPWGESGTPLEDMEGPDEWQIQILKDIGKQLKKGKDLQTAIQEAVASGHGIGKSALISWLIHFAISTHENTRGVVTANTEGQLRTKTWPELSKWHNMFIAKDLFTYTATAIFSSDKDYEKTWRIDAIPWSKNSPESFAGLHNQGNRILVLFDEASAIDDVIWEVTEGALTDANTEIIWCAFGNPTRNSGRFRECFRKYRKFWNTYQIDSRTVKISNKAKINEWLEAYGEDSDFFKVRVRGVFPSASDLQFISTEIADKAQKQVYKPGQFEHLPVIIGVDPAWTGSDSLEIVMRQGYYMKSLASIPKNDDDWRMAQLIAQFEDEYKADAVFIDMGYGTGIYSIGKQLGRKWRLIEFGGKSNDPVYLNMRAYMWGQMKEWLREGGSIPPNDQALYDDIVGPEAIIDKNGHIQLESKKDMKDRGLPSPNKGDALALTFAARVVKKSETGNRIVANTSYNPF
nr:MAG: Terminase [Bacteriophage sp.]